MSVFFGVVLGFLAVFIIMLVLVQRGRGGGLTGALGGVGGSSAFGAKAGDVFTRITIVTAAIWIVVCVAATYWAGNQVGNRFGSGGANAAAPGPAQSMTPPLDLTGQGSEIDLGLEGPVLDGISPPAGGAGNAANPGAGDAANPGAGDAANPGAGDAAGAGSVESGAAPPVGNAGAADGTPSPEAPPAPATGAANE